MVYFLSWFWSYNKVYCSNRKKVRIRQELYIIICGENQINFVKFYLKEFLDRVILREALTDIELDNYIIEKYLELDRLIDNLYIYPLNLDFSYINPKIIKKDFICRKISSKKIQDIKEKYGKSIFISCGKSAQLEKITIKNFEGTVFTTSGIDVENIDGIVVKLSLDTLDTQNYIGASEFIISKAGWGTVAECMCNKTRMILLERDGVLEDTHIINELKKISNIKSIKIQELKDLDYLKL